MGVDLKVVDFQGGGGRGTEMTSRNPGSGLQVEAEHLDLDK